MNSVVVLVCLVCLPLTACVEAEARAGAVPASPKATPALQMPATATPWPTLPPPKRPVYIVDPNDQGVLSRILIVDPDAPRVVVTITTRLLPDIVLSADGRRLVVADSYQTQVIRGEPRDVLSVFDALTGELLMDDTPIQGRLLYKGFPDGEPFLFFSDDERQLYVMKYGHPDIHQLRLTTLDAETFLTIDAVDPVRAAVVETQMTLPGLRASGMELAADGHRLFVASPDATVTVIDLANRTIVATSRLSVKAGWQTVWDSIALSSDGKRLYIGFDTGADEHQVFADAIMVYDTTTWATIATIDLGGSVMDFALSAEGDRIYAVSPFAHSLTVYSTATYQEAAALSDLGGTPARVVVPPAR